MTDLVPLPASGRRFSAERPVRLADVSPRGRVRLDAIARFLQDVSSDDTDDAALEDADGWVVRRTVVDVSRFPVLRERLSLTTWCSGTGSHWAERRIAVTGDGGASVDAATLWVHLDLETGRPRRLPAQFLEVYGEAAAGRTLRAKLSHAAPPAGAARRPWPLRVADFDVLGHVNNTVYWQAVEEELSRRRDLRAPLRAELEHRSAVEPGATPELVAVDADDGSLSVWVTDADAVAASAVLRASGGG